MPDVRLMKSATSLPPRFTPRMGHRPPFNFWRNWCKSVDVLLWSLVFRLAVNLQPPSMCVLVSGDWRFMHVRDGPDFLWHLWMLSSKATSRESPLARHGALEYV